MDELINPALNVVARAVGGSVAVADPSVGFEPTKVIKATTPSVTTINDAAGNALTNSPGGTRPSETLSGTNALPMK